MPWPVVRAGAVTKDVSGTARLASPEVRRECEIHVPCLCGPRQLRQPFLSVCLAPAFLHNSSACEDRRLFTSRQTPLAMRDGVLSILRSKSSGVMWENVWWLQCATQGGNAGAADGVEGEGGFHASRAMVELASELVSGTDRQQTPCDRCPAGLPRLPPSCASRVSCRHRVMRSSEGA